MINMRGDQEFGSYGCFCLGGGGGVFFSRQIVRSHLAQSKQEMGRNHHAPKNNEACMGHGRRGH